MRKRKAFTISLLTYLVLFMNMGPSFHRLDIFGFHEHQPAVQEHACSCCDHADSSSEKSPVGEDSLAVTSDNQCSCSLCDYFAQFNVIVDADFQHDLVLQHIEFLPWSRSAVSAQAIASCARGPPVS